MVDSFFQALVSWVERMLQDRSSGRLHTLFFRGYSVLMAISGFSVLLTLSPVFFGRESGLGLSYGSVWVEILLQSGLLMVLAEVGLRLIRQGKISGFWIGLLLSFQLLVGTKFLLGLFGLYALLNPQSQSALLGEAPQWLQRALSSLKINFIR